MKNKKFGFGTGVMLFILAVTVMSCKKEGCTDSMATNYDEDAKKDDGSCTYSAEDLPTGYDKFYNVTDIYVSGSNIIIKTTDLPDHGSPFYHESDAKYEAYNGSNVDFSTEITAGGSTEDPDIAEQNITFTIPMNPAEDASHQASTGGPIGVGINGVVFYNQYNGAGTLLNDLEFDNTDQYNGHPSLNNGQYHYHLEPLYLTATKGSDALIGVLLDGFFLYGPVCQGVTVTNGDLDIYHGHTSPTPEFPDGIYHYHTTSDAPWINGDGYWGTPGTVN